MLFLADKEDIESITCNIWLLFTEHLHMGGVLR